MPDNKYILGIFSLPLAFYHAAKASAGLNDSSYANYIKYVQEVRKIKKEKIEKEQNVKPK